ncbi:unnamed protein product [Blepharisma stoltei]|uniref:Uncharacterized protein n=1 Tax=Blepharisma stoltei TaxID=1481888 RepID=A0AAU9JKC7_9CILI|nr:unnamed protein product [Blepharisma stoltei]
MGSESLIQSIKRLKQLHSRATKRHVRLITLLDSIEIDTVKEYPNKVAFDLASFEEFTRIASDLYEQDTENSEITEAIEEKILEISKIKRVTKSLKQHLIHIKERLKRDGKIISTNGKRVTAVVKEYRERCRIGFIDHLKMMDLDLRRILKPIVPNKVIDENVNFPKINNNESLVASLESSQVSKKPPETVEEVEIPEIQEIDQTNDLEIEIENEESQIDKLNAHIGMLVNTLETVAKDLIQVLGECNRKYYEIVNPAQLGSGPPTPLAMPLPEYFTFEMGESQEIIPQTPQTPLVQKQTIQKIKSRLNELKSKGELSTAQCDLFKSRLEKMMKEGQYDLNKIFHDTNIPVTKREEIVFKLINPEFQEANDVSIHEILDSNRSKDNPNTQRNVKKIDKLKPPIVSEVKTTERKQTHEDENQKKLEYTIDEKLEVLHNTPADTEKITQQYYTPKAEPTKKPDRFYKQRKSLPASDIKEKKIDGLAKIKSASKLAHGERVKQVRVRSSTPVMNKRKTSPLGKGSISLSRKKGAVNKSMM